MASNRLITANHKLQTLLSWVGRNERTAALALVALGFLIRLILFIFFRFCWGDCQWYTHQVLRLTAGDFEALIKGGLGMNRVLFSLTATALAWLIQPFTGAEYVQTSLQLLALLTGTASIWLIYLLGKKMFNYKVGLFSAFVLTFFQAAWYYSANGLSENPAAFTTLLFLVLFVDGIKQESRNKMALAGLAFYAGLMVREDIAFLIPLILYMLWKSRWKNIKPLALGFFAPFLLTIPLLDFADFMDSMTSPSVPLITYEWYAQPSTYGISLQYILKHFDWLYLGLIGFAFAWGLRRWREGGYFLWLWFVPRYLFYIGRNLGSDYGRFFFLSALTMVLALGLGTERLWATLRKNQRILVVALLLLFAHNNNSLNVLAPNGFVGHYLFIIHQEHGSDQELRQAFNELQGLRLGERDVVFEDYSINLVNLYSQASGLPSLRTRDAEEKAVLLKQYAAKGFPAPEDFWKCSEILKSAKEGFAQAIAGRTPYALRGCKEMFGTRIEKFGVDLAYEPVSPHVYRMRLTPTAGSG